MTMPLFGTYSITLLFIFTLLVHVSKKENQYHGSYDYFRAVILATGVLVVIECLSWLFDGITSTPAIIMNYIFNYLLMYLSAIPVTMWFLYFDYKIYYVEDKLNRKRLFYLIFNIMIFLLVTYNAYRPFLFDIDSNNHFVGMNGALFFGILQALYLLYYLMTALYNKRHMDSKNLNAIVMLVTLPLLATILQNLFVGAAFIWPVMSYVCYYTFLAIEQEEMSKDALTQLRLRRHMESRIMYLLQKEKQFTLILIDLDHFKAINDQYGHNRGDEVLKDFAGMLQNAIHRVDSAFRYAGDEFIILYENHSNIVSDSIISKLKIQMKDYNENTEMTTKLDMSYGLIKVDGSKTYSLKTLMAEVDDMMYDNKRER